MPIHRLLAAASAASVILLAACEGPRGVGGTWDARHERYAVEFRSDSTFLLTAGPFIETGRYAVDGSAAKLEPTGAIAASVCDGGASGGELLAAG